MEGDAGGCEGLCAQSHLVLGGASMIARSGEAVLAGAKLPRTSALTGIAPPLLMVETPRACLEG